MKHPFAGQFIHTLKSEQTRNVSGGFTAHAPSVVNQPPKDGKSQPIVTPILPPVYFTQAIGEDGGALPEPDLV